MIFSRVCLRFTLLLCMLFYESVSFAATAEDDAKNQLQTTINQVLHELQKPELHNPQERKQIMDTVESIIFTLFDFQELSMRTVGPSWKNFTEDQKKRFQEAFTQLLRETYLEKLDGYDGESVEYTGEQSNTTGTRVEIFTSIPIQGKNVHVSYRMLKKNKWIAYDVVIEGVSMVQNYRSQFQDSLVKDDIEGLIKQVNLKANQVQTHNDQQRIGK